jgi:suppressor for copper-sensitivity B
MCRRARLLVAVVITCGCLAAIGWGQVPPTTDSSPPRFDDPFGAVPGATDDDATGSRVDFSGRFTLDPQTREGRVSIEAHIQAGWHLYSTTQPAGGPRATVIVVPKSAHYQITGEFVADRDANVHTDPAFPGMTVEEFEQDVTWSAPIRVAAAVDPAQLRLEAMVDGQVCEANGTCELVADVKVPIPFAGFTQPPQKAGEFASEDGHVTISGHVEPKVAAPGGTINLVITASLAPDWHIYAWAATDPKKIAKPTLIVLRKTFGWRRGKPQASAEPKAEESGLPEEPMLYYHENQVSWTVPMEVPKEAQAGQYDLAGSLGFQTCTPAACDLPTGLDFKVSVAVAAQPVRGTVPFDFSPSTYEGVAEAAASVMASGEDVKAKPATAASDGLDWSNKPLATILGLAFLAGLILNVMPCVLPVIGLKIMSFVHQAGGSRREILTLNIWFSLGLLTVFWILAGAAVRANLSWAEHFGSVTFMVSMIGVVFAFALSFLGVWEIPIPGFVGSSKMQGVAEREGAIGAFSKGVLSTILATPCAGPLMVPAVSWAIVQPPGLTFLAFTCIGLGMATPYLLIGAFPSLVNLLPKPGPWMETFKQLMGFLLLGAVVFLFASIEAKYTIATLVLLLGISIGCWWLGRTPMTASAARRLAGWAVCLGVIALAAALGFVGLVPRHELPWIPYNRATLEQHLGEGRTVLVDFTAHW